MSRPYPTRAFPSAVHQNDLQQGMTLRDYFAGQALIGLLMRTRTGDDALLAKDAYIMADAMMAAMDKA